MLESTPPLAAHSLRLDTGQRSLRREIAGFAAHRMPGEQNTAPRGRPLIPNASEGDGPYADGRDPFDLSPGPFMPLLPMRAPWSHLASLPPLRPPQRGRFESGLVLDAKGRCTK